MEDLVKTIAVEECFISPGYKANLAKKCFILQFYGSMVLSLTRVKVQFIFLYEQFC